MEIDTILRKYKQGKREDLIPLLQEIQAGVGYISEEAIIKSGKFLGLSVTKIYSLATFYDKFKFIPVGKVHIKICHGTSCFLNGSQAIISKMKEETGILPGQTSRDGLVSYEIVSCMGGCNNGPVMNIDNEYVTHVKATDVPDLIKRLKYIAEND